MPFWSSFTESLRRLLPARFRADHPVIPVVRLAGVIGAALPFRPAGLSIAGCASALERAFSMPGAKGVALVVNSPGGSPVQSHLIFRRIRDLAEEKKVPVFVFVEDAAASGGYMLACAGDEIFADPSSIVGSIGVVSAGFGFDRLIERFGIERRVHTVGERKAMLDPFRPERPEDVERLKAIQHDVHETFVGLVKSRRAGRLPERDDLFSGVIWTGREALEIGLVDGLGDLRSVMRTRFGDKVRLRLVPTAKPSLLARLLGRSDPFSTAALVDPEAAIAALERRAAWARLGL
jgi:signal peptide peptidase SppA